MKNLFRRIFRRTPRDPQLGRPAWIPALRPGNPGAPGSRLGGLPLLADGIRHPRCKHCQEPLTLLMQLSSEDLPPAGPLVLEGQLLQLFYCLNTATTCIDALEGWRPFSGASNIRLVPDRGELSEEEGALPAQTISAWEERLDYPSATEIETMEIALAPEQIATWLDAGFPSAGEKLGGWMRWSEYAHQVACPACNEPMRHVFQLGAGGGLPVQFGDAASASIQQCSRHPQQLSFSWMGG